jgi:hypothetical protein
MGASFFDFGPGIGASCGTGTLGAATAGRAGTWCMSRASESNTVDGVRADEFTARECVCEREVREKRERREKEREGEREREREREREGERE